MFLRFFIGLYNLSIAMIFIPANISIIWIICKTQRLRKFWSYRIMANIAIINGIELIVVLSAGLMSLLNMEFPTSASIGLHFWSTATEVLLSFMLATNRLFVMVQLARFDKPLIYKTMLMVTWSIGLLAIYPICTITKIFYDLEAHRYNVEYNRFFSKIRLCVTSTILVLSAIMYTVIVLKISFQRKKIISEDAKLFVQALLPFVWLLFRVISSHFLFARSLLGETLETLVFVIFGRSLPAFHFIVYMVFNRTLRNEVRKLLRLKKKPKVVHVKKMKSTVATVCSSP
ncbi:hypothetical protein QR680_010483 [Steinernema hermaphroditum]|uniref:Uncharacterized protein n=1 Tax=Steinernema hermaphroditum TaxID=289476 RepID=A0AA39IP54_9BILA|nr:hypothetical protein QR680_010483 [Steinernema hermaphroditum]